MMDFFVVGLLMISFACVWALTAWCYKIVEE